MRHVFAVIAVVLSFVAFAQAEHPLDGIWEQHLLDRGQWISGGLFEFASSPDSRPRMNIIPQFLDPALIKSHGLSNVRSVDDVWTFDSDWGRHGIGNFQLKRQSADQYVGHVFQDRQPPTANDWKRVAILSQRDVYAGGGKTVTTYKGKDQIIVAHTFEAVRGAFVASSSVRNDNGHNTLKCVILQSEHNNSKAPLTIHWSLPLGNDAKPPTDYSLDPTILTLTPDEIRKMAQLLKSAIEADTL
jgi:hypothetical protein